MFLELKQNISLKHSQQIFVGFSLFEDNSLCLITSSHNRTLVDHYSNYKLINSYFYNSTTYFNRTGAIDSYEIVLLQPQVKKIQMLNVQTGQKHSIPYQYSKISSPFDCQLKVFSESKCFCVVEVYRQNEIRKAQYTFFNKSLEQVYQYQCDEFHLSCKIFEMKYNSKLVIVKGKQSGNLKINVLDFKQQLYLTFEALFPLELGDSIIIKRIYEIDAQKMMVFCQSDSDIKMFEWNLQTNQITKLSFEQIQSSEIYDVLFGGDYYYILMFSTQKYGKSLYIVDGSTHNTICSFQATIDYQTQYELQIFNGHSRIAELKIQKSGRPNCAGLKTITITNQKQLYINIMQEMGGFTQEMIRYVVNSFKY